MQRRPNLQRCRQSQRVLREPGAGSSDTPDTLAGAVADGEWGAGASVRLARSTRVSAAARVRECGWLGGCTCECETEGKGKAKAAPRCGGGATPSNGCRVGEEAGHSSESGVAFRRRSAGRNSSDDSRDTLASGRCGRPAGPEGVAVAKHDTHKARVVPSAGFVRWPQTSAWDTVRLHMAQVYSGDLRASIGPLGTVSGWYCNAVDMAGLLCCTSGNGLDWGERGYRVNIHTGLGT